MAKTAIFEFSIAELKAARAIGRRDFEEALRLYKEHIQAYPDSWFAMQMIAECYATLNQDDQAIEWGTRALALQAGFIPTFELLAGCYSRRGDHDRAYQCVCRVLEQPPHEPARLPSIVRWIVRALSLVPRFRTKFDPDRVQAEQDRITAQHAQWRQWAMGYKEWYEANRDGPPPRTTAR